MSHEPSRVLVVLRMALAVCLLLVVSALVQQGAPMAEPAAPRAPDAAQLKLEKKRQGLAVRPVLPAVAVRVRKGADAESVAVRHGADLAFPIGSLDGWVQFAFPDAATAQRKLPALQADPDVEEAQLQRLSRAVRKVNDPYFGQQWHLKNTGQTGGTPGADINAEPAWASYTGSGVVVSIVDDGVETSHPDLGGYEPAYAYDYVDNDSDPNPGVASDMHGTSVAGLAIARADNNEGGAGAAHGTTWTAVRLLGSNMSDSTEAAALGHALANVDVYNNSWGAPDTGDYESMGSLAKSAIQDGVANGRGGKGAIYVWAAGNGHAWGDNSNLDEYASLPETIAIAAMNKFASDSSYSEAGANILVAAPGGEFDIFTTDVTSTGGYNDGSGFSNADYTDDFDGTSAATPIVTGVVALMLEANSNLTWRDVQHILVHSSDHAKINGASLTNGAGLAMSDRWGFGLVQADAAVNMAAQWVNVPARTSVTSPTDSPNLPIPDDNPGGVARTVDVTNNIYIEHVVVEFTTNHTWWGDLRLTLTSPTGTVSKLASVSGGLSPAGTSTWRYTSTRHWGEQSQGTWQLRVSDELAVDTGDLQSWKITFYGTNTEPTQPANIGSTTLADATQWASYSHQFAFNGISQGRTWSLSGNVPPGISINPGSGMLAGTPTSEGTFDFTVSVTANSPPANASVNVSLEVLPGTQPPPSTGTGGGGGGGGCTASRSGAAAFLFVFAGLLVAVRRRRTG